MPESVETPRSAARNGEVEEYEAVDSGELAFVQQGEEAVGRMNREIGDRHFARKDEGRKSCEEAEHEEEAADEFDIAGRLSQESH